MQGIATTAENSASGLLENKEELKSFICTELMDILNETKSEFCLPSFHQHNFDEQSPRINTTNVVVEPGEETIDANDEEDGPEVAPVAVPDISVIPAAATNTGSAQALPKTP